MKRPGFLYQPRLELLAVKALPSLIDGPGTDTRDLIANLLSERYEKALRPDSGVSPAGEEPGQERRNLPAKQIFDAVRACPIGADRDEALGCSYIAPGKWSRSAIS